MNDKRRLLQAAFFYLRPERQDLAQGRGAHHAVNLSSVQATPLHAGPWGDWGAAVGQPWFARGADGRWGMFPWRPG